MRTLLVVALSLGVHAISLGYLAIRHAPVVGRVAPPARAPTAVEPESPIAEVQLFEDAPADPSMAASPVARPRRERTEARTSIGMASTEPHAEPPTAKPPTIPGPSMLSMRHGPDLESMVHRSGSDGLSDDTIKQMIDGDLPVKIANVPGAQAAADLAKAQARLSNPKFVDAASPEALVAARQQLAKAREDLHATELVEQRDGTYRTDRGTYTATVEPDGTVHFKDGRAVSISGFPPGMGYDIADVMMRHHDMDPYAADKRSYLERTRDQRVEIGRRFRHEQLSRSGQYMITNLERVWATGANLATRKALIFQLWDECAETGDDELVAGATEARRLLTNFVQVKLRGANQFTAEELAALNAHRSSSALFSPYAAEPHTR